MFPHTVTIYTPGEEDIASGQTQMTITVLRGVLFDANKANNTNSSGLVNADAVNLYIPFDVDATDGVTGEPVLYASPKTFAKSLDKTGLWTLDKNGSYFAKGEVVVEDEPISYVNDNYDDVYRINSVDEKDFGSLQHWEVGGA